LRSKKYKLPAEAANRGALQINCSALARKLKLDKDKLPGAK